MRTLIQNGDLKRLFAGAALAVVAGLAMSAAVQPKLQNGLQAPQQQMPGGGARTYAMGYEHGVGAYPGPVPDYVIGTNWLRPPEPHVLAYDDYAEADADAATAHAETSETVAPARWKDEPHEGPLYPSERGNAYNPSDLPAAPEPPVEALEPA